MASQQQEAARPPGGGGKIDPLRDVRATRPIRRIWCGGPEVQPAGTGK